MDVEGEGARVGHNDRTLAELSREKKEEGMLSRLGKKVALFLTSATALVVSSEFVMAQDISKAATPTKSAEADKSDAAILAKYDRLDAPETRARLGEFLAKPATKRSLEKAVTALAAKKVDTKSLEQAVTPLVAGRGEDDASVSMDAIMRHYYDTTLAGQELKANEAEALLEKRAGALDAAVYGKATTGRAVSSRRARRRARR